MSQQRFSHENRNALIIELDDHIDATLDRLDKGLIPLWDLHVQRGNRLVTLASGALVFSISAMQLLGTRLASARWGTCVPIAWILFAVTVLGGAAQLAHVGRARSYRLPLELNRGNLRARIRAVAPSPTAGAEIEEMLIKALNDSYADADDARNTLVRIDVAMYCSFALGLILLLAFTIKNLPF